MRSDNNVNQRYLSSLNPSQLDAVINTEGPLLVLAGAGTGKTKVLTTRIAHIIHSTNVAPNRILAVTFTNKAAKEMNLRINHLTNNESSGMWLGTFHSIAAKILRQHADLVGLTSNFTIIDSDDQLKLIKQILVENNIDSKKNSPKNLLYIISRFKDKAWSPDNIFESETEYFAGVRIKHLYAEYQQRLKSLNAVDFGDLTLYNIKLFNENTLLLKQYQNKFKYILVDEYQDTNVAQYIWLKILAQTSRNICCVGDDDQSIYGWRGAEIANILKFDKDFNEAKIIRLEENYRSTNHILGAATGLISYNKNRHGKNLWTEVKEGQKIKLNSFYDDYDEARFVAEEIETYIYRKNQIYSDIAVLIRAGYQSRSFEESFNLLRISYRIVGGVKFYERLEIKDVISYIRILVNPCDSLALERIINTPKRGIGDAVLNKIKHTAKNLSLSYFESIKVMIEQRIISGKIAHVLQNFFELISQFRELLKTDSKHWQVVENLLEEVGYLAMWHNEATQESKERLDNIKELLGSLQDYTNLNDYLEHVALVNDNDTTYEEDKVNIMTIHAAKGLEFETVFLTGWEEGTFPSQRSLEEKGNSALEEERRLAYVAITRAKNNLYISYACNRKMYGSYQACIPSRFIHELPCSTYEVINNYGGYKNKFSEGVTSPKPNNYHLNSEIHSIVPGNRVFHIKFGYGYVNYVNQNLAEVSFEKSGVKRMMIEYLSKIK